MATMGPVGNANPRELGQVIDKPVYKVRDLATLLGCSSEWVTRLIRQGRIRAGKPFGGHWRILASEVERLQREGVRPTPRRTPVEIRMYRVREVATLFGCSNRWITRLIRQGSIRAGKPFEGHWRIPWEEVERLQKVGIGPSREAP